MSRFARTMLVAAAISCLVVPAASAAPNPNNRLGGILGDLWTTVLETPTPDNPFAGGDPCVDLGGILAPFGPGPSGSGAESCTVERGTKIFVVAWSTECSTFEGNGTTEAKLRACAEAADRGLTTHTVAVDGQPVPVSEVKTTGLLTIRLPKDNIFELTGGARNGLSVAHGWVTLLDPLTPGTHTIEIHLAGTYSGNPVDSTITTTIFVL
jgi:hypothetical protein